MNPKNLPASAPPCWDDKKKCFYMRFLKFLFIFARILMFNLKSFCLFSKHFIDWVVLIGPPPCKNQGKNIAL